MILYPFMLLLYHNYFKLCIIFLSLLLGVHLRSFLYNTCLKHLIIWEVLWASSIFNVTNLIIWEVLWASSVLDVKWVFWFSVDLQQEHNRTLYKVQNLKDRKREKNGFLMHTCRNFNCFINGESWYNLDLYLSTIYMSVIFK